VVAYSLAKSSGGVSVAIPILGALALGAQRMLPMLQQVYGAWTNIRGGKILLVETIKLLEQPLPPYVNDPNNLPLIFKEKIDLRNIFFKYSLSSEWILSNLNLTIYKGTRVGFIGKTGSGKSTLLDIVMGLLEPNKGALEIDGKRITNINRRGWQNHIAHVPQSIYLADSSIMENIAFGIEKSEIDFPRVITAAKQAQIDDDISTWPDKYETHVGERGIRLSGGQRQRIGIARALYRQANVIIFDEATSSLDADTEQAVMQAIDGLSSDLTILIIAHRLSTIRNCDQVVDLTNHEFLPNTPEASRS